MHRFVIPILLAATLAAPAAAQVDSARARECSSCAEWNEPQAPFRVFGNTYWVGTHGLGSILVTSAQGHVLIDGALPESAPQILASIRALGFRPEDVKLILNTHAHFDHAGGIAVVQRASGARVATSPWSATVLEHGTSGPSDPQYGVLLPYPSVSHVDTFADGDTMRVGPLALVAHFTGSDSGKLPCPVMIIPGGLSDERLEQLS